MKRIYIILALLMCAVLAFSAQAVETNAGETVVVPVYVDESEAYQITLTISFDTEKFEYSAIRCFAPGGQATFAASTQKGRMMMYDIESPIPAGEVGFITLKVKDSVALGEYDLTVTVREAWDLEENPVEVNAYADKIVVKCPHTASEEVVVQEADCETDGLIQFVCLECKEVIDTKEVEKFGHAWSEFAEVVKATCTDEGVEEAECARCGEVDTRKIAALGHAIVELKDVEATCTASGLTKGEYCSRCEEVLVKQEVVPAIGHAEVVEKAVEPTCTETGLTEGSYCANCGEVLVAQKVIPELGHKEGEWTITVQPTTEIEGRREKCCTVCASVLAERVIPKLERIENIADPVVKTLKVKKNETVELSVYVSSNKASVVTVLIAYDPSVFEFVAEASDAGLVKDGKYLVYTLTGIVNGKIGTVTLKVKDAVQDGLYEVSASVIEAFDFDENPVVCKAAVDKVLVATRLPGDVNEDGIVDGRDLLRLAKYIGGFEVIINEDNSTVNGDDIVDGRDLLRLAKYIGGHDTELK